MAGIYFKKYSGGNYFNGLDFIDKLKINHIPLETFPVFHADSEEIGQILKYNPGEFIISLSINTGEISTNGKSIERFFRETDNNKFIIILEFGTTSPKYYLGSFDNSNLTYFYYSRKIDIRVDPIDKEIELAMRNHFVGTLDSNRSLDDFLTNVILPSEINTNLNITKSFSSYNTLIGDSSIIVNAELLNNFSHPFRLDIFDQFQQLMWGTGLLYKAKLQNSSQVGADFPKFTIYVFNLDSITSATAPKIFGDPEDTIIFNRKPNLMISYRNFPVNQDLGSGITLEYIRDGVGIGYFGGAQIKTADYTGRSIPLATSQLPAFWHRTNDSALIHLPSPGGLFDIRAFTEDSTNFIDLPLFSHNFPGVFGLNAQIAFARVLNNGGDFGTSYSVYNYTIQQYKRYLSFENKKCKVLQCFWGEDRIYEPFDKITLPEEGTTIDYYINRVEDIKPQSSGSEPPNCKLTLVEL